MLVNSYMRKKRLALAHCLRIQSIRLGISWKQEHEIPCQTFSCSGSWEKWMFSPFEGLGHWKLPYAFRVYFPHPNKEIQEIFFQTWPEICFYWDFKSRQAPIHVHIWIIIAKFLRLPYSLFLLYYYFIIPYYYNCSNDKFASLFPVLKPLNHLLKHMCNFLIVKVPESLKIWIYPVFLALVSSNIDTFSDNWN